jgi:hypothetical protein
MVLFSNKQEANLRSCIQMVEDALVELGHSPDDSRIDTPDDLPAWRVLLDDASHIDVFLGVDGDKNVLRIVALVGTLPPGPDEAALFRRLLELNVTEVKGLAFGLQDGAVVLVTERATLDLDPAEVVDLLRRIEGFASHYGALLARGLAAGTAVPVTR